jgi:hypothetical protein
MFTCFSQQKNLWFKQGLGLFLAVVALVFTGCPQPTDPEDVSIKGRWVSTWDEVFRITDTEFINLYAGEEIYKGNIVNIISDGKVAGYIIIKYTLNDFTPEAVGNYYTVHYKNLTESTVDISGCSESAGKETQAEAETEYTVDKGYFPDTGYSTCTKSGT